MNWVDKWRLETLRLTSDMIKCSRGDIFTNGDYRVMLCQVDDRKLQLICIDGMARGNRYSGDLCEDAEFLGVGDYNVPEYSLMWGINGFFKWMKVVDSVDIQPPSRHEIWSDDWM